ncbi:pyruvate ferredoxin oxidoreductase, partial [Salmonella enterica subsp. enterica serovar Virchow]|nr:pyruvate ferredoxin oxidoreductase [Salmonella enterica subsp. enterica serovar Virchow]
LVPVGLAALERAITLNGVSIERNRQAFAAGRLAAVDPAAFTPKRPDYEAEPLDEIIERRERFLTDYQNADWAARYRATVDKVRVSEQALGSEELTIAVARSLFKLMSYKDEYEVARLHMQTGFLDQLHREFEGGFKVNYHFAPPFMNGAIDARGRPVKRRFGQWMQTPLRVLAGLKGLRGTAFDPFGYSAERRMERDLIGWYEGLIDQMLAHLPDQGPQALLDIARAPMDIRGYGPVKDAAVEKVKARVEKALATG